MHSFDKSAVMSSNERQKQATTKALEDFFRNDYVQTTLQGSWDLLATKSVTGSSFDLVHRPGSFCLRRLIRHPEFLKMQRKRSLPDHAAYQVDKSGRIYHVWENLSSTVHPDSAPLITTSNFFSRTDITVHVAGIPALEEDLKLLTNMAAVAGGVISSSEWISVGQWLDFQGLPLPSNEQDAKELIDLLNFATLPEGPRFGNYWQLLDAPEDSPFKLTENNRAIIRQVTEGLTGGETTLVAIFGDHLLLESTSADRLPTSLDYRLQKLIEIAVWVSEQGQAYIDALGWFTDETKPKPSQEFVEQLLIAAMLLDLDPAVDSANTMFADFDLYSADDLMRHPSSVLRGLEKHLVDSLKLDQMFAPLVARLVLGGMAPQYLFTGWPSEMRLGTPAWVVGTQAVHFAEALIPGVSRKMTYQHLLGLGKSSQATPQLASLHATHSVDPIVTWALMNKIITRDANGHLSQEAILLAAEEYEKYLDKILNAATALGKALPHRKPLALKELKSWAKGCDPDELLVKVRGSGGGAGRKVSVLDLYMGDELHSQDWNRVRGTSIYQSFPDLARLYPANHLYEEAINRHHSAITEALASNIEVTLSQLPLNEAAFIEYGAVGIYCIEQYTTTRFPTLPTPGGIVRPLTALPGETGRYGVILCAHMDSQVRCYELFPLRLECRFNPELESVFRPLVTHEGNGRKVEFVDREKFDNVSLDVQAYLQNQPPRSNARSRIFIRKIGEFQASLDTAAPTSTNPFFRSTRKEQLSKRVTEKNPYLTVEELKQIGLDQTERERAIEKTDAIFNTVLNMIIPFKECVEEMSSGVPDRQRNALLGCVMDAAALVFAFAVVPGKIAAISSKATTVVTKLLSASRIGAGVVVGLFNPLDGIPQLLKGGAKLIGKGALKVGHYSASGAHIARNQLRHLTGANSYDLIKAINHTSVASQLRRDLDTVAHARALFKSDGIETAGEALKNLHANDAKLLKQVPEQELQHLLENALADIARTSDSTPSLTKILGSDAVDSLIRQQAQKYSLANLRQFKDPTLLPEIFNDTLKVEYKNLMAMNQHQTTLLASDLGRPPYSGILDDLSFNPNRLTDNTDRATAWILKASSSRNEADTITSLLHEYNRNGKSLTDPAVYKELHRRLVPEATDALRSPTAQARYPSNVSGAAMLEKHLATLDPTHEYFGKQLLGSFLGYHSFVDGNGRTARAIYAITELRANRFNALPVLVENALSGLA